MKGLILAMAAMAAAGAGCGYRVAGRADMIPRDIKTIAVPAFGNATTRYGLARLLPADITREFLSRTRYAVVADPGQADAVLSGVVDNYSAYPTTSDPNSGRATGVQVVVMVSVTLTDRHTGKLLYTRQRFEYRQQYEVALDPTSYFDESGTATIRVSRDVARSVVSGVLEAF
jgi:hypothetical protein